MRRTRLGLGCGTAAILLALGGCGDGGGIGIQEARLRPVLGCGELEVAIRKAALREMEAALDKNLAQALLKQGCGRYGDADANGVMPAPSAAAGATQSESSGGASQVSKTNNQVAGVDEADFIKNDNKYLYVAANGAFRIIQAWPPTAARELARIPIEGTPKKLFVEGDRALVYSSLSSSAAGQSAGAWSGRECTYGYNCAFTGDGRPTKISIFSITDRTAPVLIRALRLSGSYLNARRIGSAVHTVLSSPGVKFPSLPTWPSELDRCSQTTSAAAIELAFARLRTENARLIAETPLSTIVPSLSDQLLNPDGTVREERDDLLGSCRGFFEPSRAGGGAFTTLLSLDLQGTSPVATSTIVSEPGAVYASAGALYLAVPQQRSSKGSWYSTVAASEATAIHKFALEGASSSYLGSGLVKGRVLNQFAMDEWSGHLRVATTTGRLPSKDVHSTLTILGRGMLQAGVLDQLAPSEDIRSVRFDGARGFVVTFKKTDPLFVFDLANPYAPRTLAELKIPGFSTYMHLMDANHLLTIGYDASDQGSFAWFTGVMLQIFDISNPTHPTLAHKEVIGTRGSSSEALTNHLAFTYFAPKQLLALPMTVCEGGTGSGSYGTTMSFSGLMVYNVTAATGFKLTGKVEHLKAGTSCHTWWTNATSTVKRSIVMDDYVFSVTDEVVKANHLANLPVDVAAIPIK
jgi:hypothetical protein